MIVMECHDLRERNRRVDELSAEHAANASVIEAADELNQQKAGLVGALVQAAEDERRWLAAELHDGAVQQLAALGFRIDRARRVAADGSERVVELLDGLAEDLSGVTSVLRGLMSQLRPPTLDEVGLAGSVNDFVMKFADSHELFCASEISLGPGRLPAEIETTIFRITQEAITNVGKHARASEVRVEIRRDGDRVRLTVEDNGCGFDVDAKPSGGSFGDHYGLIGMRDRAERVGGTWSVASEPGHGTRVIAEFDLAAPKTAA